MKDRFLRKLRNDPDLREIFKGFLEDELEASYNMMAQQTDIHDIYRHQGKVSFIKKLKGYLNG